MVDPVIGEAGDLDTAVVMLKFANGVIGTIDNSRRAVYGYDQRVEVHGSLGLLAAGNRHATTVTFAGTDGYRSDPALPFFLERYAEAYRTELTAFLDAVSGGNKPEPTGYDGLMAQRLADAATESARTGKPVRL